MKKSFKVQDSLEKSSENGPQMKKSRKFYIYDKEILEKLCANSELDDNSAISEDELKPEELEYFDTATLIKDEEVNVDATSQSIDPQNLISSIQMLIRKHKLSDVVVTDLLKAFHAANPKCPKDIKSFMNFKNCSLRLMDSSQVVQSSGLDFRVTQMEETLTTLNDTVNNLERSIKDKKVSNPNRKSFRKPLIFNEGTDNELHIPISTIDEFEILNERLDDTDFCETFIECLLRRVPLNDLALEGWLFKVFTNIFEEEFLLEYTWNKIKPQNIAKILETIVRGHFKGMDYTYFARRASGAMRRCTFIIRKRLKKENYVDVSENDAEDSSNQDSDTN